MNLFAIKLRLHYALTFLLLALIAAPALAQDDPKKDKSKSDTTEISWSGKKFVIVSGQEGTQVSVKEDVPEEDDWFEGDEDEYYDYVKKYKRKRGSRSKVGIMAFDVGMLYYLNDGQVSTRGSEPTMEVKSFRPFSHWAIHALPTRIGLFGRGVVNLKFALSFDFNFYHFNENITLETKSASGMDSLQIIPGPDQGLKTNRLHISYFQIPLVINFNTSPGNNKGVQFNIGGFYGWRMNSSTKQVDRNGNKNKRKDQYYTYPFHYGFTGSVKFRWLEIYGNWNLSPVFYEGEGPKNQTFTVGLRLFTL